jgi:ATP-dependent RNA helicase RhlE
LTDKTFEAFGFAEPLARALTQCEYTTPTPIQVQALPPQLEKRDLLAMAETGSGKTAAFVLPLLQDFITNPMNPNPREVATLILAPTRELALQINQEVATLSRNMHNIRHAVVLGGVSKGPQISALKRGLHVLVATPGRLLDHVSERYADLRSVRTLVIDEADRMFDMGFIRDIKKIVAMLPRQRRTALFSATMPNEIRALANDLLTDPVRVDLSPKSMVVDRIDQKVMIVRSNEKQSRLHTILADPACSRVIIFARTKRGADRVADRLGMAGIGATAIHGNKAQNARQRALADFSEGHVRVLVATDIAARGIDVSDISHVINFDMPIEPETYVHRIGRTARKGLSGIAISLCDPSERSEILAIERLMKQKIQVIDDVGGEVLPMPEKRPHHTHEDPRRVGAHRKGPPRQDRGGERRDGRRFDNSASRDSKATPASLREGGEGFNPARADRVMPQRDGAAPRSDFKPRPDFKPREDRRSDTPRPDRKPEHRSDSRPGKPQNKPWNRDGDRPRNDAPKPGAPYSERPRHAAPRHEGPRAERPKADASGPRRAWDRDGDKPRTDGPRHEGPRNDGPRNAGPRADAPRPDRPHSPGSKPAHSAAKPHRDATKPHAGKPNGAKRSESNWNGQKPPKFLKRSDEAGSGAGTARPNRKPAA